MQEIKAGATPTKADVERRMTDGRRIADEEKRARKHVESDQADAERQQREAEQAWQARARELAKAGKAEAEIGKERQLWDTAKQREERQKQIRLEAGQRLEEEQRLVHEKCRADRHQQREKACEAADLLRTILGKDFEAFRSLMAHADVHEFQGAVLAEPPGQ